MCNSILMIPAHVHYTTVDTFWFFNVSKSKAAAANTETTSRNHTGSYAVNASSRTETVLQTKLPRYPAAGVGKIKPTERVQIQIETSTKMFIPFLIGLN